MCYGGAKAIKIDPVETYTLVTTGGSYGTYKPETIKLLVIQ